MSPYIQARDRIFVAGHQGLIGSAIVEQLKNAGYNNLITRTRSDLDLINQLAVREFYEKEKPSVVFVCAAKVGGILANSTKPAEFLYCNVQIQNNVIWGAHESGVRSLIFLGSSCIYPRNAVQPIREDALLTGMLEETNRAYAVAKISGLELVHSLRQQYGRNYFSVMPTNLYGPKDNFHPDDSHVIPGLIHRFVKAKENSLPTVAIWGTGQPKREFLYSEDCAAAIVKLAEIVGLDFFSKRDFKWSHINVGTGEDISISDLAYLIRDIVGFKGIIEFDSTKPDGTPRKVLNVDVIHSLGIVPRTDLKKGCEKTIDWYLKYNNKRQD